MIEVIEKFANAGPFTADWDSLGNYQIPEWYQDAKFGIFIHWGVYSVPAFGCEWYPREMYQTKDSRWNIYDHHKKTFGGVDSFGYKDLIPMFKAENYDPAAWADLFRRSGARYIVPVAEHHDGFAMYDSELTEWNAMNMGPKRDLITELASEVRKQNLHFGVSNHRAENWWFYDGGREIPSDVQDDRYRALYGPAVNKATSEAGETPPDEAFLDSWLARCVEQVDRFQAEIMWFDWWMAQPAFHRHLQVFSSYYYNRGKTWPNMVAINYKKFGGQSYPDTAGVLDIERGQLAEIRDLFWQTDTSVSKNSWGYIDNHDYKTVNSLIDDLIDIVSKNGCMLLNIGPRADGTIPETEQQMLLEMGAWLEQNGEAIYGTRPWKVFGEGSTEVADGTFANNAETGRKDFTSEDIRFTKKGDTVYALILDWPGNGKTITIRSTTPDTLGGAVGQVSMLGSDETLDWSLGSEGMKITMPSTAPGDHAYTLKISPEPR